MKVQKASIKPLTVYGIFFLFFALCSISYGQDTVKFSYTGSVQTFTVPSCVHNIHVKAWGAGGSGGGADSYPGAVGGAGGYVQSDFAVTPGQSLTIIVGGGAGPGGNHATCVGGGSPGWGNGVIDGGAGGNTGCSGTSGGGGGGGGGTGLYNGSTALLVAGGGGGGSGGGQYSSGATGGAGGQNGNSVPGSCTSPGIAGASGNGDGTAGLTKGSSDGGGGGGGGGGYNGGTGGGVASSCDCGACGGGGGNGYASGTNTVVTNGNGQTPGNSTDPDLPAGDAVGGSTSTQGGNGYMVITYTLTPAPITINATSATICNGSSTTLSASGANTYTWSPSTGLSSTTGSSVTANPTATTIYTVIGTSTTGCTGTDTEQVTVTVNPLPVPTVSTVNNVSCYGGSDGSLAVNTTSGSSPYNYSWTTSPVQTTSTATGLSIGTYSVTVTDGNGCSATSSGTITQPTALDTSTTYTNVLCFGDSDGTATINVSGGTPGYTYAWSPSSNTGSSANNLTAGSHTVTVTDANGCQISKTFTISQPTQLTLSAAGFDASCYNSCNGQAVVIPSGGTTSYHYLWTPGNGTTASITNLCTGTYCITVTDGNGCTADSCVTINQPPQITLDTSTVAAHCMHNDGSATVTVSGGTPGYTYQWTPGGQTTATANNLVPGQYCVLVTDANGCSDSICVNVSNMPGVSATLASSTDNTCYGSCDGSASVSASGGTTPYTYAWSSNAGSTASVSNLCAGSYTCVVADAYTCLDTVSVTINQPDSVVVYPDTPDTICVGQSTNLTASALGGNGIYSYTWTPSGPTGVNPTSTTTYTVVANDSNGCLSAPKSITLNVRPPLTITTTNDTTLCIGGTATIGAMTTGGDGSYTYQWNPGGISGTPVQVSPNSTTTYTVSVVDNCGTPPGQGSITVNINPLPIVSLSADTLAGCFPLCVNFTNSTPQTASAAWDFGDGSVSDSLTNTSHCYSTSGFYTIGLTVTDVNGCTNSLTNTDMIDVYPKPQAAYNITPQPTTLVNPRITFNDKSNGAVRWLWDFGDSTSINNSDTVQNTVHTYSDTGTYCTSLIVMNSYGCIDTTNQCLRIDPEFTFYIPNAFSPNGDGLNDYFSGKGIFIKDYEMFIYDRWGHLVFHSTNYNDKWNGTVNKGSNPAQEDTYIYRILITDINGNKHKYTGHVSIIR